MADGLYYPSFQAFKSGQIVIETIKPEAPWGFWNVNVPILGARTNTQPVDEAPVSAAAVMQPMFGADYYNRIHISTRSYDVGNLLSLQTRQFTLWNAYLVPKTLANIAQTNTDGLTLIQPSPTPLTYGGLKENTYTLQISTDGPPTIDAAYLFNFTDANDPQLTVIGSRITAWVWQPTWTEPMLERLEWMTDVITAYDGTEQRIKLRGTPRRNFEFSFVASGTMRRKLDSAIYGWGARNWAVPVWTDGELLTTQASAGASTITVSTSNRDYHAGGLVILLADSGSYEVAEISSKTSTTLTLLRPLNNTWAAQSCTVYPVRTARLQQTYGYNRFTGDVAYGRVRFDSEEINDYTAATEATTYRGYPVLTEKPNWIRNIDVTFDRKLAVIDFGYGEKAVFDESGVPTIAQNFEWFLESKQRIADFRAWLYARAGKYSAFWTPTWVDDMVVNATIASGSTTVDINYMEYTRHISAKLHRKDIRIELNNGTVFYRRITGSTEVNSTTERISIDSALGIQVLPSEISRVSFMALSRLDADGVEINYFTGDTAQAAHPIRAIGNGV